MLFNIPTNEITKEDFDAMVKRDNLDVFTENQVRLYRANVATLISKSISSPTQEDSERIKVGKAELNSFKEYSVVENKDRRLVKSIMFVQEKQVSIQDTLEKSLDGKPIQKLVYLDTPLNKELNRVGNEIILSKGVKTENKEMYKAVTTSSHYALMKECLEKGMSKEDVLNEIKKAHPELKDDEYNEMKKAYNFEKREELKNKMKDFED